MKFNSMIQSEFGRYFRHGKGSVVQVNYDIFLSKLENRLAQLEPGIIGSVFMMKDHGMNASIL